MPWLRRRLIAGVLLLFAPGACGGDNGPAGPDGGPGTARMTAKIDGDAWVSDPEYAQVGAQQAVPGVYLLSGTRVLPPSSALSISLTLYNITGPGTYALGMGPTVIGGVASVGRADAAWITPLSGAAGSVTVTTLTESRITGTFAFTATPVSGSATGPRVVTDGAFDLPVTTTGVIPPLPEEAGSRVNADVGSAPWNASTVMAITSLDNLVITGSNTDYTLSMALASATDSGSYELSNKNPLRMIQVTGPGGDRAGAHCCWGGTVSITDGVVTTNDIGTITITSFTQTRVRGTLNATLAPVAGTHATSPLVITNGEFDVGLLQKP